MSNERNKIIKRKAAWFVLKGCVSLNKALPLSWNYSIGNALGSLAYLIIGRHRKIAINSLTTAFPQMSLKEKKKISRFYFAFMAQSTFELLSFVKNPRYLKGISIEGKENLKKALDKKKGVLLLTAHLGNFPLMLFKLAKEGYPINIVARPMRDKDTDNYVNDLRTEGGVKTIFSYPRKACISSILNALRNNEIVVIQMDQNFGTGGVWVKFFGKLAATAVGPITLALRTKAAVVPVYMVREGKGKHQLKIFPEEELIIKKDKDEAILINVIKITRIIEGWIRKFPYQWAWVHRRWKSRPSEQIKASRFKIEE
ncbi:MAG: lysophospholipid acyltransferase family protein [Candidatus Omnitrophica bacterium]|nr:lysophospholipid acyltransferase family protein [Candidatus Omnitrophota bacterium]